MKVLINNEWKDYAVKFGKKMSEDTGGVRLIPSDELELDLWTDAGEVLEVSVGICEASPFLLVRYIYCPIEREEDYTGYYAQFSAGEALAYAKAVNCL